MGYIVSFPKQAVEPKDIRRFDDTIASVLVDMDEQLARRFLAYLTSNKYFNLPELMTVAFKNLPFQSARDLTWDVVLVSAYGYGYRNAILNFSISNANRVQVDLTVKGSGSGYKKSCRSLSCSSGHQTSFSEGSPCTREILDGIHRHDAPPKLVPDAIFDATLKISSTIDLMRGKGIFDSELKMIETVMGRLKESAPLHHVEVISRLSKSNKIIALHPTAEIRLDGYVSHLGEFSSHWEMAKAEGRDPTDWMGIRYLLPCLECLGTGVEQTN